jgi:natural product precursor
MKKKLSKLTLSKETLRNLSEAQLSEVAGGYSLGGTCDSCNFSCDPSSVRICPPTSNC